MRIYHDMFKLFIMKYLIQNITDLKKHKFVLRLWLSESRVLEYSLTSLKTIIEKTKCPTIRLYETVWNTKTYKKKKPEHFTHVYTAWSKYSHRQRGIKLQLSGLKHFTCTCNFHEAALWNLRAKQLLHTS